MGYPGEDLSISQLISALNKRLFVQQRAFDHDVPGAETLAVYKQDVQTVLATINRRLNAHQPISRLPDDILVSIPTYFGSEAIQLHLVELACVCKHWRRTFISASSLWSTIHLGTLPLSLLLLSLVRSRTAPVRLHIGRYDYHLFADIVSHMVDTQRIEYSALQLDLKWEEVVAVSRLASSSASHLRVLSLNVTTGGLGRVSPMDFPFSYALTLQELSLRLVSPGASATLGCFRFAGLTALSIFCMAPISQNRVLEFLRISPRLGRVELDFRYLSTDNTPCPPVHLRHLRRLRIDATTSGDSHLQLFENLICPVAENFVISIQPIHFDATETSPFQFSWGFFPHPSQLRAIELRAGPSTIEAAYSIGLLYGEASRFEISFRFVSFGSRLVPFSDRYTPTRFSLFQEILRSLRALSPGGVTQLSIAGIGASTIPDSVKPEVFFSIRGLLAGMEKLETITISSGCLPAVCRALAPQAVRPTILCPILQSVEFLLPTSPSAYKLVEEVAAVREARATAGYAIRSWKMTPQGIPEWAVGRARSRTPGQLRW